MLLPMMGFQNIQPQGDPRFADFIKNIQGGMQFSNKMRTDSRQAEREKLENALKSVALQYAPEMQAAELAYTEAQTPHMNAQTGLINQQSKFAPLQAAIDAQRAMNSQSRFGTAYQKTQALKAAGPDYAQKYIEERQDEYTDMLDTLSNKELEEQYNKQNSPVGRMMEEYFPQGDLALSQQDQTNLLNSGIARQGNTEGMPIAQNLQRLPGGLQSPVGNPQTRIQTTPEQREALVNSLRINQNRNQVTNKTRNQSEGGTQLMELLNSPDYQNNAISAARYAGIKGEALKSVDMLSTEGQKKIQDAEQFVKSNLFAMKGRIKALENLGSTDEQRKEMNEALSNLDKWYYTDPNLFIRGYNKLGKTLEAVEHSVEKAANPNKANKKASEFVPIPEDIGKKSVAPKIQQSITGTPVIIGGKEYYRDSNGQVRQR